MSSNTFKYIYFSLGVEKFTLMTGFVLQGHILVFCNDQCWEKLLLKVMRYNVALLPKKVSNYVT